MKFNQIDRMYMYMTIGIMSELQQKPYCYDILNIRIYLRILEFDELRAIWQ